MALESKDCVSIAEKYFCGESFDFIDFNISKFDDASLGLISSTATLIIKVQHAGELKVLHFFCKMLPQAPIHKEIVIESKCFVKESAFYFEIQPHLEKYQKYKSIPCCYFGDCTKIVLEDLTLKGFKNYPLLKFFDLDHCKIVLKHLADFHASSLIYEKESGAAINDQFPDVMFLAWFSDKENHPGHIHMNTGITALQAVMHNYFDDYSDKLIDSAISIMRDIPKSLLPSDKHKNCLSHCDLWCNNLMFKYENGIVKDCRIIDFQLFGYNPPALDVLIFIYTTTSESFRKRHLSYLLDYYYSCIQMKIKKLNYNHEEIFSENEFKTSLSDVLPVAAASGALFLQYVLLPENELLNIMSNMEKTKQFMFVSRNDFILQTVERNKVYKERILMALKEFLNIVKDNLSK